MSLQATKDEVSTLADVIDRVLDKGLVINADICVSVAGVELLGIKIRAALASFETAANYEKAAWKEAEVGKEICPQCGKKVAAEELLNEGCPWCGWISARAKRAKEDRIAPRIPAE
jgi:predicted RNA-binding Zn-ribbon protein involved in translation (DUF1610 family)